MWRSIAMAALVYAYGHPKFDGYRPAGVDRALQAFHLEVNKVAEGGRRSLPRFDEEAAVRYVKNYVDKAEAELKPSNSQGAADPTGRN